jgi:hypothetical protein
MVDFRTKDGKPIDRVALKKSGKFPAGLVSVTSDIGSGYALMEPRSRGVKAAARPTTRSGATISADTASKLNQAIAHSQKAIDTCQALIDGPAATQEPAPEEKLRRQWAHAPVQ